MPSPMGVSIYPTPCPACTPRGCASSLHCTPPCCLSSTLLDGLVHQYCSLGSDKPIHLRPRHYSPLGQAPHRHLSTRACGYIVPPSVGPTVCWGGLRSWTQHPVRPVTKYLRVQLLARQQGCLFPNKRRILHQFVFEFFSIRQAIWTRFYVFHPLALTGP